MRKEFKHFIIKKNQVNGKDSNAGNENQKAIGHLEK